MERTELSHTVILTVFPSAAHANRWLDLEKRMPKMNLHRAQELIVPLKNGTANDISLAWKARLIEALEYVIEHESQPEQITLNTATCPTCKDERQILLRCPKCMSLDAVDINTPSTPQTLHPVFEMQQ